MHKEKSCGCIVFNNKKEVLLVKMKEGHWSFPKGHVENDESEYETAYREVKEETNIDCKIVDGFRQVSTYYPKTDVIKDVVFFVARSTSNSLKNQELEVSETDFYTIDEAYNLLTFKADINILKNAVSFANF